MNSSTVPWSGEILRWKSRRSCFATDQVRTVSRYSAEVAQETRSTGFCISAGRYKSNSRFRALHGSSGRASSSPAPELADQGDCHSPGMAFVTLGILIEAAPAPAFSLCRQGKARLGGRVGRAGSLLPEGPGLDLARQGIGIDHARCGDHKLVGPVVLVEKSSKRAGDGLIFSTLPEMENPRGWSGQSCSTNRSWI